MRKMFNIKKFLSFVFPFTALIFELLPNGVVLRFANPEGEPWIRTYSHFDMTPFGYANFAPFIVAILTCVLLVLVVIYIFVGQRMRMPVLCVALAAALLSFAPLLLGFSYFSLLGLLISLCLVGVTLLTALDLKKE